AASRPFSALIDPSDGQPGHFVAQKCVIPLLTPQAPGQPGPFGQERIGSNLSIAVDPRFSNVVYVAWCDLVTAPPAKPAYTLHMRRSTDRGVSWSNDLLTVANALNPGIAINSNSKVGFLYQQL